MIMQKRDIGTYLKDQLGYCSACDEITDPSTVDPFAINLECPECRKATVCGIAIAVVAGLIVDA